jgi:hypothetical protein
MDNIVAKLLSIMKAGFKIHTLPPVRQNEMQDAIRQVLVDNKKVCAPAKKCMTRSTKRKVPDETPLKRTKRVKRETNHSVGDIIAVRTIPDSDSNSGSDNNAGSDSDSNSKWSLGTITEVKEDSLGVHWMGDPYHGGANCPTKAYRPLICNDMQPWVDTVPKETVLSTLKKTDFFRGKLQPETLLSIRRLV